MAELLRSGRSWTGEDWYDYHSAHSFAEQWSVYQALVRRFYAAGGRYRLTLYKEGLTYSSFSYTDHAALHEVMLREF